MNETISIALIIVGCLALIVVVVTIKARSQAINRKSEILETFNRIVADEKLTITKKEILKSKILGIDEVKKTLVVVRNYADVQCDIIELTMVNDCMIKSQGTKTTKKKKNGQPVSEEDINEIFLSLIAANRSVIDIPVYSELHDGVLEKMILTSVAEKWRGIISANLSKS